MRILSAGVSLLLAGLVSGVGGSAATAGAAEATVSSSSVPIPAGEAKVPGVGNHVRPSCSGTGADGNRVQVLYVRDAGQSSQYSTSLPTIRDEVATVDDIFMQAARRNGGGRKVRWVHDSSCAPVIREVVLPAGTMGGGFSAVASGLRNAGYSAPDRKYLVFANSDVDSDACGRSDSFPDSSASGNQNDRGDMVSLVDRHCWAGADRSVAAHELGHSLGAVQAGAPHATAATSDEGASGHCTDGHDVMCDWFGNATASADCQTSFTLDCHSDDYFSTNPSGYLASHWNIADSSFLDRVADPSGPAVTLTQSASSTDTYEPITFTIHSSASVDVDWRSNYPSCITGGQHSTTLTIQCQSGQGEVDVTAYVTGADDGLSVVNGSYTLGLTTAGTKVAMSAPTAAAPGEKFTVSATVSGPFGPYSFDWQTNPRCTIDRTTDASITARCTYDPSSAYATFSVDVYDRDGYYVSPGVARVKITNGTVTSPTTKVTPTLTIRAAAGYPTRVTGMVTNHATGRPVSGARVRLQAQWNGTSKWSTLATATSSSAGTVSYRYKTTRAGHFRLVTVASPTLASRASGSVYVKAPVKASLAASGRTLVSRVTTGAGKPVGHAKAVLYRRGSETAAWKQAGPAKYTTGAGTANFSVRPSPRTYFQVRVPATSARACATRTIHIG